jgi:translation initiation factor 2 alpha subunit (eIF-2alpha)
MTRVSVPTEIIESVVERLRNELRVYRSIVQTFEKTYLTSLEAFERRIEQDGVLLETHEHWEDSIEWRNTREAITKLETLLARLDL